MLERKVISVGIISLRALWVEREVFFKEGGREIKTARHAHVTLCESSPMLDTADVSYRFGLHVTETLFKLTEEKWTIYPHNIRKSRNWVLKQCENSAYLNLSALLSSVLTTFLGWLSSFYGKNNH